MSWVKAAIEGIARHGVARVRPAGESMRGCIESGQAVTLVRADYTTIETGDVVFIKWKQRSYILHLVLKKRDGRLLIGNSLGKVNGWADGSDVIGKVIEIIDSDNIRRISRLSDLKVTFGNVTERPDGLFSVEGSKIRVVQRTGATGVPQAARVVFSYDGVSLNRSTFKSGLIVTQIGLKLLAADSCNLCYAMWRLEPVEEIVVSIKRNPGMRQHAECGNSGYTILSRQTAGKDGGPPSARDGRRHSLQAEVSKDSGGVHRLLLAADGFCSAVPIPGKLVADLSGPPGFRTDNGVFAFDYHSNCSA